MSDAARTVPTDILISAWALDAAALQDIVTARTGAARTFLAGACADDLADVRGPLELVTVTVAGERIARHWLTAGPDLPCQVSVDVLAVPLATLRSWSPPISDLLVEPGKPLPTMPLDVAAGFHAVGVQRDLVGGTDLLAGELEELHAEVLPLYLAAQADRRLSRAGRPVDLRERLGLLMAALLGAGGQANPHPSARLPLFERFALRSGIAPVLVDKVRRVLTETDSHDAVASVVSAIEALHDADPVLRFCRGDGTHRRAGLAGASVA